MEEAASNVAKPRLKFIDLARSIAILLMLEGHFVDVTLMDAARIDSHPVYATWRFVRGLTAPLFFTVAGMIFVFLLMGEDRTSFFKRERVRKGFRRAGELLLWGYILQLSVYNIPKYLRGDFAEWAYAFHVLQCIGVGLVLLVVIAAVADRVRHIPLTAWYVAALVICLTSYVWLESLPKGTYVPDGWSPLIQNAIRGPNSVFPLAPWLSFAFLGGAMGAYLRSVQSKPVTAWSYLWFFVVSALLGLILLGVVLMPMPDFAGDSLGWFVGRASEVVALLGLFRFLEIRFGIGLPWMLRIGRETFAIFILHVIVLYGAIFWIGLNSWLEKRLEPWEAAGGALVFVASFAIYGFWLNKWKTRKRV